MPPVGFTLADVGDMYLDDRNVDGSDAVGQSDGGVRVGPGIHYHPVVKPVGLL